MGLLDSLPFISSLYGSDKNGSVKRSWSRISHTHSDAVPLNPNSSTTEEVPALPQQLDLELANTLLSRASQLQLQKVSGRQHVDDGNESQWKDENISPTDPGLSKRTSDASKTLGPTDSGYEELDPTTPVRTNGSKSSKRSRRLEGLKKLLGRHKLQEQTPAEIPDVSVHLDDHETSQHGSKRSQSFECGIDTHNFEEEGNKGPQTPGKNIQLDEASEPRKVSDQTILSLESDKTSITVCRRPSKHASTPIATVDRNYMYQNPFEDVREASHSQTESNPFTDRPVSSTHSTRLSSSAFSDSDDQRVNYTEPLSVTPKEPIIHRRSSKKQGILQEDLRQRSFAAGNLQLRQFGQRRAAIEYNRMALKLHLHSLPLSHHNRPMSDDPFLNEVRGPKRKDVFLRKIRSMRSNLTLRSAPRSPGGRTLRRIKTLANLANRSYQMDSLKGKSLETIARLGGHSFLTLPADFAPCTLRLPVCIVATASYLKCYAPKARNIFLDHGDLKAAARMYDHYANQVLSAEKEKIKIDFTMRECNLPSDSVGSDRDYLFNGGFHVHSVGCVFKQLLAGLPGGILGSTELYRTLVDIYERRFFDAEVGSSESRLGGISSAASVKIKVITLAILALTTEMQLALICAVFGLCTLLLHETERLVEIEKQMLNKPCAGANLAGLLDLEHLARVFSPLLTSANTSASHDPFVDIEREIQGERVTVMLIENWRSVSRQLRVWEVFRHPTGAGRPPSILSEGKE
ncbi:hypothetical protein ANI_1_1582124 [Paecilomyces variotii No. 5]|uniref:Uncharacterized protein n=1 Tax=Byssochlamys spectabilis (strain No. 5 / NBRC 109023) TaxID=1356009 RepID=V5FT36_BYSSN|nr:hypothetical protein ANI_1_1582124 [Paecilomyces variotii No. 5]